MYKIATFFTKDDWESHGLSWIDKAYSQNLSGYLLFDKEIEFKKFKGFDSISCDVSEKFSVLSSVLDCSCLYTTSDCQPIENISVDADVLCGTKPNIDLLSNTIFVNNLYDRAAIIKYMKDKPVLSCSYILGKEKFWECFSGFQRNLMRTDFINTQLYKQSSKEFDDILLNFFFSFFNFSLETFS